MDFQPAVRNPTPTCSVFCSETKPPASRQAHEWFNVWRELLRYTSSRS